MNLRFIPLVLFTAVAASQPLVETPRLGCIVTPEGRVREILGLKAALIASEGTITGARDAVCGNRLSVLLLDHDIVATDEKGRELARVAVRESNALLSVAPDGESAVAYLPATGRWLGLLDGAWEDLPFWMEGEALAMAAGSGGVVAAVARHEERLWLVSLDRATGMRTWEEPIESTATHAFVWPDGAVLLAAGKGMVFRQRSGERRIIPINGSVTRLAAMSERGVRVSAGEEGNEYGLVREGGEVIVFAIPGGVK